ncbi:hypothetical protein [Morganella morganii]|uniref:hypothetical protein n=1 Tax=Morganella morganii TaxID=582 RepID=UPI001E49E1BF|nr:hypothetical protein [Morganella morganii]
MMQKEIVQPVSADTGVIEQFADNPSPCAPLTPSAETRYLKAMAQTDHYHRRYNPSYALLDEAEPAPVIPASLFRSGCPATHTDTKYADMAERAMASLLRLSGLTSTRPARFLLLTPPQPAGYKEYDTPQFPELTQFAPVKECVTAVFADGQPNTMLAWAVLMEWAQHSDPVYIVAAAHHAARFAQNSPAPFTLKGEIRILSSHGRRSHCRMIADKLPEILQAPSVIIREIYSTPAHPLHYISCREGYFHIPQFSRFMLISEDGSPAAADKSGLLQLNTPLLTPLPAQRLLTTDICEQGTGCACGSTLPWISYCGSIAARDDLSGDEI